MNEDNEIEAIKVIAKVVNKINGGIVALQSMLAKNKEVQNAFLIYNQMIQEAYEKFEKVYDMYGIYGDENKSNFLSKNGFGYPTFDRLFMGLDNLVENEIFREKYGK